MGENDTMARPRKPAAFQSHMERNYTKEEITEMEAAEEALRGGSEQVNKVPSHLSDLGKQYYKAITEEMKLSGVLSNLDIPLVSLTAETLAIIRDCEEMLNEEGLILEDGKPHPAVNIRDKNLSQVRSLMVQLGMTPSSRASIAVDNIKQKKDDEDPLLKILKGNS